jgi:hypothetical protein
VISCLVLNWGITVVLGLLLAFSEYLAKTKRFKENGIIDFIRHLIRAMLYGKGSH